MDHNNYVRIIIIIINNYTTIDTIGNGEVRLVDGLTQYEGRVEIWWNSEWRTVSSDGWDESDAKVVCRQLGYLSTSVQVEGIHNLSAMIASSVWC